MMNSNSLLLQVKNNRRDSLRIISDILLCAVKGVRKTELLYKTGISSAQLDKYAPMLIRSELLEISTQKKRRVYRTTIKGKSFLDVFNILAKLLD